MLVETTGNRLFLRVSELRRLLKHEMRGVVICDADGNELTPIWFMGEKGFNAKEIYAVVVPHKMYGRVEHFTIDAGYRIHVRIVCTYRSGLKKCFEEAYSKAHGQSMTGRRD